MKILIGVDGSPASLEAVSLVGRLIDPRADEVAIYFSPAELQRRVPWGQTLVEGASKALFDEAEARLPQPFTRPVEVIVSTKSAAAGILEAAIGWKADLVVVGASNQTSLERFLLGSVSRAVVHGSTLPVLVVRNAPAASESIRPITCYLAASAVAVAAVVSKLRWPVDTSGVAGAEGPRPALGGDRVGLATGARRRSRHALQGSRRLPEASSAGLRREGPDCGPGESRRPDPLPCSRSWRQPHHPRPHPVRRGHALALGEHLRIGPHRRAVERVACAG